MLEIKEKWVHVSRSPLSSWETAAFSDEREEGDILLENWGPILAGWCNPVYQIDPDAINFHFNEYMKLGGQEPAKEKCLSPILW